MKRFEKFAFFILLYNLAVIVWGAYVRASGSGAGCGSHWPLCNGEVIPAAPEIKTIIEFAHRASSGLSLIFIVVSFFWSRRLSEKGESLRAAGLAAFIAILIEAAVGAGLVLLEWVGVDRSIGRTISIAIHLITTCFLMAALTSQWWIARALLTDQKSNPPAMCRDKDFKSAAMMFILVGMLGAITALGDTLFPAKNWTEGLQQHQDLAKHFLVSMRIFHPLFAITWLIVAFNWIRKVKPVDLFWGQLFGILVLIQVAVGGLNLLLLAPIPLQLMHLLMANLIWIALWLSGLNFQIRNASH